MYSHDLGMVEENRENTIGRQSKQLRSSRQSKAKQNNLEESLEEKEEFDGMYYERKKMFFRHNGVEKEKRKEEAEDF